MADQHFVRFYGYKRRQQNMCKELESSCRDKAPSLSVIEQILGRKGLIAWTYAALAVGLHLFGGLGKLAPILYVPPPASTKIKADLVMVIVLTTKQVHGKTQQLHVDFPLPITLVENSGRCKTNEHGEKVDSHLVEVHSVCALLIEAGDMDDGSMMNMVFDTGDGDLVLLAFNAVALVPRMVDAGVLNMAREQGSVLGCSSQILFCPLSNGMASQLVMVKCYLYSS
uniref:Uncharacterized protein n=1 Tax=Oryza glumipatula TaxID=40148 RepID=A0A0D9ZBE2_9ORYZ